MILQTERLLLRPLMTEDAGLLSEFRFRNQEHLGPWEQVRDEDYFSLAAAQLNIEQEIQRIADGSAIHLYVFERQPQEVRPTEHPGSSIASGPTLGQSNGDILGNINVTNIVRAVFLSCYLGYRVDYHSQGKGVMSEALEAVVKYVFEEMGLHRIEANIIPRNIRSRNLVRRIGFREEGLARDYLYINGVWEDHIHYVLLNDGLIPT